MEKKRGVLSVLTKVERNYTGISEKPKFLHQEFVQTENLLSAHLVNGIFLKVCPQGFRSLMTMKTDSKI